MVSIIIPCYNAVRWIRETLESVRSQVEDKETIVIDDGSTDDTAAIVAREFPGVKLIRTSNRGASHARNTGTNAASGEYIQYLDADDLLAPGKITKQLSVLQETAADVVYGDWQRLVPRTDGNFMLGERIARQMRAEPELELFGDFWCPPAAYLFRRWLVDTVGGWNERLPIIQDARFALDCALRGGKFVYCPGIAAYYRDHVKGSLSTRDPVAFVRDVHLNALEVETWWKQHGGLTPDRERVLINVLSYVARASYDADRPTFEAACAYLESLRPCFVPDRPRRLAVVSRLVGYRRAEALASAFRRNKIRVKRRWRGPQSPRAVRP
jgi:glycosyltransferase involved in cell wall biosynthesis